MTTGTGSESTLRLASRLRQTAPNVRSYFDHKNAADLMELAAAALERLAPFDPDIDVVRSET